jgi:hypothetical protein
MASVIAQEFDVGKIVEPVGVVREKRVGRPVAECEELLEYPFDPGDIAFDLRRAQKLALKIRPFSGYWALLMRRHSTVHVLREYFILYCYLKFMNIP